MAEAREETFSLHPRHIPIIVYIIKGKSMEMETGWGILISVLLERPFLAI